MKNILVTGAGSYIGKSIMKYLQKWPGLYSVRAVSMRDGAWKQLDFSEYDIVVHVAGIAHRKESEENRRLYYSVNRDMTVSVAKKAKEQGVKYFIFFSTMSVYGKVVGDVTPLTVENPLTNYGKSKLEAESILLSMVDDNFSLGIVRPPMVYGKGCKGNFFKLVRLVDMVPIFPICNNRRSMIYIGNLCEFVKICIDQKLEGIYCPQNKDYVCTDDLVRLVAQFKGRKVYFSALLGNILKFFFPVISPLQKAFGSLKFVDVEKNSYCYSIIGLEESVKRTLE